ncbi:MAG: transglutaminase family protein [Cyanobacteriota bacterium]|nr:transglutaminase family protein [Cyanobacteriota bacterium]
MARIPSPFASSSSGSLPTWWPPYPSERLPLFRPLGAAALESLTVFDQQLLGLDRHWGYILALDPRSGDLKVLNPRLAPQLRDTYALTVESGSPGYLWVAKEQALYRIPWTDLGSATQLDPYQVCLLPYAIESLSMGEDGLYASCFQREKILRLDATSGTIVQQLAAPGVGREQIQVAGEVIWVSDRIEETVYVLDRQSGESLARILTPFPSPTGLVFWQNQWLVAYATEEPYIRDNPNDPEPLSVDFRNKTLIAPLSLHPPSLYPLPEPAPIIRSAPACSLHFFPQVLGSRASYTLSSGYRLELTYLEEFAQEEPVAVPHLVWKIALPCHSPRQKVHSVRSIGDPFQLEQQFGQQVAVFDLGSIQPGECRIFGWKAVMDVFSIKYLITPADVEDAVLPEDLKARYLVDDDYLAMDTAVVREAARQAVGRETNLLRKMARIREFVYDKLSYRVTPRIEPPDVVLQNGYGSCGEYVGLLLALARLNGIVCRTVGRYKCPPHPELRGIPLLPEYNHVWIEFYVPGWGWVPMESNPDDLGDRPYPERYFMGIPWTHAEIAKGIPFETCNAEDASIGQLAINHVQFRILDEL